MNKKSNNQILSLKQVSRLWFCKLAKSKSCNCTACVKLRKINEMNNYLFQIYNHISKKHFECDKCKKYNTEIKTYLNNITNNKN